MSPCRMYVHGGVNTMSRPQAHRLLLLIVCLSVLAGIAGCHGGSSREAGLSAVRGLSVEACQAALRGDLNGSGTPDITDAVGILRIIVGLDLANPLADCDFDGATGIADAIMALRCVVGLESWPLGGGAETIGPDGGVLATGDGNAGLDVPAGALGEQTDITAAPQATYPDDAGVVPGSVYEFGPDGLQFSQSALLTLAYTDAGLPSGMDEGTLRVHKVVGEAWEPVTGSVLDTVGNTVSAPINGFSTYGLLGVVRQAGEQKDGPGGQTLVWVPGGSFTMGIGDGEGDASPAHQVTLDGFWVGQCEVTNQQYADFLTETNPDSPGDWVIIGFTIDVFDREYSPQEGLGPYPVIVVNWEGAAAYCEYYGYSLPTEAQWEYAAAGPESRVYPWGNEWDANKCAHWYNKAPVTGSFPVGSFPAGASWCGAVDMAGNVEEWCADWYGATYYGESPAVNPTGPDEGQNRVSRGGSWASEDGSSGCRCLVRDSDDPGNRTAFRGFRCVQND